MRSDPVDLLETLVSIDSVSGAERACVEWLAGWMRERGFATAIDEVGNLLGSRGNSSPKAREIVLLGHIDTVPGRIEVVRAAGRLTGRGTVDAKGPLATFAAAAAEATLPSDVRVVVIGAVEEEALSRGARALVARRPPGACIIGEPSGWDAVTLGYKGRLLIDYRRERSVRHTAGPDGGLGEHAVAWWNQLAAAAERANEGRSRAFDRLQVSLRAIRTMSDGLVDAVEATAGYRLPPGADPAGLEAFARAIDPSARVTARGREVACQSPTSTPVARPFVQAIRRVGGTPSYKLKTGTSDMNVVGPAWGCPIVAYGPGDSHLDHTPDEHIRLDDYLNAIAVMTSVLESADDWLSPAGASPAAAATAHAAATGPRSSSSWTASRTRDD